MFSNNEQKLASEEKSSGKQMTIHQAVLDNNLYEVNRILSENNDCLLDVGKAIHSKNDLEYEGTPLELAIASMNGHMANILFDELIKIPNGKYHIGRQSRILFSENAASAYAKECKEDSIALEEVWEVLFKFSMSSHDAEESSKKRFSEQLEKFEKHLARKRKSGFHSNLELHEECLFKFYFNRKGPGSLNEKVYTVVEKYLPDYYDDARYVTHGKELITDQGNESSGAHAIIGNKKIEMEDFKSRAAFYNPESNFAYTQYSFYLAMKVMCWAWSSRKVSLVESLVITAAFFPLAATAILAIGIVEGSIMGAREMCPNGLRLFDDKRKMESYGALNNDIELSSIKPRPVGA